MKINKPNKITSDKNKSKYLNYLNNQNLHSEDIKMQNTSKKIPIFVQVKQNKNQIWHDNEGVEGTKDRIISNKVK